MADRSARARVRVPPASRLGPAHGVAGVVDPGVSGGGGMAVPALVQKLMTFTNDDLARLKEEIKIQDGKTSMSPDVLVMDRNTLKALLARLEAAEKVIAVIQNMEVEDWDGGEWDKGVEAWRKAAGQ